MFAKLALFALLGVACVSAIPPSHHDELDATELQLRNDFSQIFHAFLQNLEYAATKVSGVVKAKLQEFKKALIELKDQISVAWEELKGQLKERVEEAKKWGKEKYEEVKEQAKTTLQEKSVEFKGQIRDMQQKVSNYLDDYCDEILSPGGWESILLMVSANVGLVKPGIPMNDSPNNEQCSTKLGAKSSDELLPSTSAEPERIRTKDRIQSCVSQPLLEGCSEQQNDERVQEATRRVENLRRELQQIRFDPRIETATRFIGRFEHLETLAIGLSGDMRVSQEEVARALVEAVRQVCLFIPTVARVAETQGRRLTLVEFKGIFTRAQEIQPRVLERRNDDPRHYDSSDQGELLSPKSLRL
ncbi:hypothetical protein QAD02_009400 [Eretmocerus hayati]|uniref:Uncharacterized protein n=1 Tax=Eretmocerus hayati TaxID=131215 RepID=A0ACC2NBL0_9HYME|nr:hypothetical protein QAD02_009400 [Eretmocerus hayati]